MNKNGLFEDLEYRKYLFMTIFFTWIIMISQVNLVNIKPLFSKFYQSKIIACAKPFLFCSFFGSDLFLSLALKISRRVCSYN